MIDAIVEDPTRKYELYKAATTHKGSITKIKWIESFKDAPLLTRIVVFICMEGIFFTSAFAAIFWLKKRGLMPGLAFANKKISQDEGLHCTFACELFKFKGGKDDKEMKQILMQAVEIEGEFLKEAIPVPLIGLNAETMLQHVKSVADMIWRMMGGDYIYDVESPFEWMDNCALQTKEDFFAERVSQYQLPQGDYVFDMSEYF